MPSSNRTREYSTHGHHQMVYTKIRLLIFFAAKDGKALYSQQKQDWRIDASELWCWKRLLRVPWSARRSNQSFLKEVSPKYSLERVILKLKLQYFGHLMWRIDSFEKTLCWERLKVGEGDDRGWDDWMASLTQWTWVWVNSGSWQQTGRPGVLQSMELQRVVLSIIILNINRLSAPIKRHKVADWIKKKTHLYAAHEDSL